MLTADALLSFAQGLRRNLITGLRAALFLPVRLEALRMGAGQVVVLVGLGLALQLALEVAGAGGQGGLDFHALPRTLFYVPLLLLAAWVIASRRRVPELLTAIPILFCSASLPYEVAFNALDVAAEAGWLGVDGSEGRARDAWYLLYAGCLTAILLGVTRVSGAKGWLRLGPAAALIVLVILPLWHMPTRSLWEAAEDQRGNDVDWYALSREEVFFAQPVLLDQALGRLEPGRRGVSDLYFVGVAGDASEDVFMKEVGVIGKLFRERFDARGRDVALVNNPKTVGELPVATATGLSRALERVGRVMNRDEDVLFLYLTSHGSEDHRLSMQFWPLKLNDIDPAMLREMLDRSGIKWRVIAISACYSGGFIDALKDEHTLVITAADAEHTSFGCGVQSDFTYFGRAYFDEALRETWSFTDAFQRARGAIGARERAESLSPSNPQIYAGARIEAKLREMAQRLQRAGSGL
jgi:hypothetical protein